MGPHWVPGDVVAVVRGPLAPVLTAERTALNFVCHLSGVATLTRRLVDDAAAAANPTDRIWDTRKTLPGLRALEKAAVRAGGGVNPAWLAVGHGAREGQPPGRALHHRGGGGGPAPVAERTVEVECDRPEQVLEAVEAEADLVMLDNMGPDEVRHCVTLVAERALVERSGGVNLDNVAALAAAGADLVSTSVIAQSAPALDLGLDLEVLTDHDGGGAGHRDGQRPARPGRAALRSSDTRPPPRPKPCATWPIAPRPWRRCSVSGASPTPTGRRPG